MKKYVLDTVNKKDFTAGSKARKDIDEILIESGFEKMCIYIGKNKKKVISEVHNIKKQLVELTPNIERDSLLVVQYPWPTMSYSFVKILSQMRERRNVRLVAVIHDLNSIRTGSKITRKYYELYVREIQYLDQFDTVICHNPKMKKYLVERGISEQKVISLDIFDYLVTKDFKPVEANLSNYKVVNIAGNLSVSKTKYLYKLNQCENPVFSYVLYGPFYTGKENNGFIYKGKFPATELPSHINAGFGLVWDGEDINTCSGHYGEYMKINNPHKLSLYMACGIPVLVWEQAAVADFVKKNNLGFCISSLEDIEGIMKNLTLDNYLRLKENVEQTSNQVRSGYYIRRAISKVENLKV